MYFKDYQQVLMQNNMVIRKKNKLFKSLKHKLFTREVNKIALSCNDDKRKIAENKIVTLAWGHSSLF